VSFQEHLLGGSTIDLLPSFHDILKLSIVCLSAVGLPTLSWKRPFNECCFYFFKRFKFMVLRQCVCGEL